MVKELIPHLCCLADGLFGADGTFMPFKEIDQAKLTTRFAEAVLSGLHAAELIDDSVVSQILSQQHRGFSVWLGEPFQDKDSKHFVARYIERGPVSLENLSVQDDLVIYTTKDGTDHEFDALEFLAALSAQVPKPYESLTRYYGFWSCRARGERKKKAPLPDSPAVEPPAKASSAWARCIKQIYKINPLECPKCKSQMRIVTFVQNPLEIKKIMQSLGLPDFTAPPKLPIPPHGVHKEPPSNPFPDYDA